MSDRRSNGSGHRRSGQAASRSSGGGSNSNRPPTSNSVRERRESHERYGRNSATGSLPESMYAVHTTTSRAAHSGGGSGAGSNSQQDNALYFHPGSVIDSTGSSSRHASSGEQRQRDRETYGNENAFVGSALYTLQPAEEERRTIQYGPDSNSAKALAEKKRRQERAERAANNPVKKFVKRSRDALVEKLSRKKK